MLCVGNIEQLYTESIYFKSLTYERVKKMENFRSGRGGPGVQESRKFFSIFDEAELFNLILFAMSFLLTNIINLWRPSTNPRLSL